MEKSASYEVSFAWRKTGASVIEHFGFCWKNWIAITNEPEFFVRGMFGRQIQTVAFLTPLALPTPPVFFGIGPCLGILYCPSDGWEEACFVTPENFAVFVKISSTSSRILDVEMRPPKWRRVRAAVHTTQISRTRNHVFTMCPFVYISIFVYFRIIAYFSLSHAPSWIDGYLAFEELH